MRFFRLLAIGAVLLILVGGVLGTACGGAKGADGVGIQSIANNTDGTLTIYLTNGQSYTTGDLTGPQGEKGDTGLAGAGIAWQGEWSSSLTYRKHDAVGWLGSTYVSKQDSSTNHVPTDTAWWDLWVAKGDRGDAGIQGLQGNAGPNMIVAMGSIDNDGTILEGYNVAIVTWTVNHYEIALAGITQYDPDRYVTVVTPLHAVRTVYTSIWSNKLSVHIKNNLGEDVQNKFHFVVFDPTLG